MAAPYRFGIIEDIQYTGVGSMGAPGAGAPMKFLSGTHTYKVTLCLELFSCYRFSVHIGIRAPVYQIIFLRLCSNIITTIL